MYYIMSSKVNILLVKHVKSLYNTACILSKQNNIGFVPLPISKVSNRQGLFNYANILNNFIRHPGLSYLNREYKKKILDTDTYIHFPEEIIQLKYKK